jgi:hypothetical protein
MWCQRILPGLQEIILKMTYRYEGRSVARAAEARPRVHGLDRQGCCVLALAILGGVLSNAAEAGSVRSVALPDTEIVDLPKASNGIDYQLYVHVPPACKSVAKKCPSIRFRWPRPSSPI